MSTKCLHPFGRPEQMIIYLGDLETATIYFLRIWGLEEGGTVRFGVQWEPAFSELDVFSLCTHMEEGARVLSWASFMRTLPSCPNYFLTASLSNTITLGIRISTYKLWGNINMLVYFIPFVATVWFWLFKEQLTALNHIRMCYNIGTGTLRKWFNLSLHQFSLW